jgi:hypothetical protein
MENDPTVWQSVTRQAHSHAALLSTLICGEDDTQDLKHAPDRCLTPLGMSPRVRMEQAKNKVLCLRLSLLSLADGLSIEPRIITAPSLTSMSGRM